jgi:serine protease Do
VALDQFSSSVQALARRLAPSVVKIVVTGYGPRGGSGTADLGIGQEQVIGSGFVLDSDGYIVTNAHVVANAQKIRVGVVAPNDQSIAAGLAEAHAPLQEGHLGGYL